jgi:thiol-disulfide isomerase/thioredoxin
MSVFETKIYGLSILTWIMIIGLILYFYFFVHLQDSSNTVQSEQPTQKQVSVEERKENFAEVKEPVKVYNFNTEWCGYSLRFQPEWNKFMTRVNTNKEVGNAIAYDVKCDKEDNEKICAEYQIEGFPTVIFEKGNDRKVYQGSRSAEALIDALKKF